MKQSRSGSRCGRHHSSTPSKSLQNKKSSGESQFYYCHFKNAIYMGGIKAFQKHGRGILIHDNGTSAVTSYFNDFKNGHNIYYMENCILSVEYQKNKIIQIAIRISVYLILLRLGKEQKPEGKCLLVDYNNRKIYYAVYRKGVITQKRQERDLSIINKIFDLGNIEYLIGKTHASAVKFELERDENIASQKTSSRFQAGFYKKGHLNGLGFNLMIRDPSIDSARPSHQIFIRLVDRGYYTNSNLNGMGEQRFKNGNTYWGNFRGGVFEGLGILKNQMKKNWVYGEFLSGDLCQLLQYSHDGDTTKLAKIILSMHQRKNSWINNQIEIQPYQQFVDEIQNIIDSNPTQQMNNLKSKKQQVLKKIQNNFLYEAEDEYDNLNQQNDPRTSNADTSSHSHSRSRTNQSNQTVRRIENEPQQSQMQQSKQINRSANKTSRFKSQAVEPLATKGSSERMRDTSSRNLGQNAANQQSKVTPKKKEVSKSPIQKNFQNQQELSFALDSKRMIGKSRIFKQYSSEEPQLPKFNYTQT